MRKFLLSFLVLTISMAMYANKSVTMDLAGKGIALKDAVELIPKLLNCSNTQFVVQSQRVDQMGTTHIALTQTLDGTPIHGAMILVHCKDDMAMSLNGQYATDAELPQPVKAISKAKARKKAGAPKKAQPTMVIVQAPNGQMRWAYETVNVKKQQKVWVDAETGEILRSIPLRYSIGDVTGSANTLYMGNIPMTSFLTAEGDYLLYDEGRKIYTYDASQWDNSGFNGLIDVLDNEDEDAENELTFDEIAAQVKGAYDQLVSSSKEYRSTSADWSQKEIRQVSIELLDEEWAQDNFQSLLLCALIIDKNKHLKEQSTLIDLNTIDDDAEKIVLPFINVCHVESTDSVEIVNVIMDDDMQEVLSLNTLACYSIGDALNAVDNTLTDSHLSCEMDIYNGPWLDVHAGMQAVYDYYKDVLGRDSYDGEGAVIRQFVNVPHDDSTFSSFPLNACALDLSAQLSAINDGLDEYSFAFMAYGAGDGLSISSLVGFDVLAHEFTHLVTAYRGIGDLEYNGESGAINEAISDIMACAIGHGSGLDTNWLIGENVMLPKGTFMRSMQDPKLGQNGQDPQPDTYGGEYWADPNNRDDNGGVHTNSGVMNHWYYLLCEGGEGTNDVGHSYDLEGLGIQKATNIVYNSLLYGFTPTATYQDACDATVLIAQQIYGESEAIATAKAWEAVGVIVTNGIISGISDAIYPDNADSPGFNIQGVPVNDDYRGIVIKKGQKFLRQ